MPITKYSPRNHPQQIKTRGVDRKADERGYPPELFQLLQDEFAFTVDAAASHMNAKLPRYWTIEDDGLEQSWQDERVYCNPPYSNIRPWVVKAWEEVCVNVACPLAVLLLPATRTEQGWWQDLVEPERDQGGVLSVRFLRGRRRFIMPGDDHVKPNSRPPFGLCLLIFRAE